MLDKVTRLDTNSDAAVFFVMILLFLAWPLAHVSVNIRAIIEITLTSSSGSNGASQKASIAYLSDVKLHKPETKNEAHEIVLC